MRKCRHYIAVLAVASLAIAGCNKFENFGWLSGDAIRFGVSTQGEAPTKTAYGTYTTDTGTGKRTHQMIDWKADDVVRIVCAQASTSEKDEDGNPTKTSADYKTSAGTQTGTESRATLSLNSNNKTGLRWGSKSEAHVFYGVYPSPYEKSGDELTVGGSLTGNIPESQTPSSVSGTTDFVANPDMTNQYMVAKRTVAAGTQSISENEVFLYFTPITTAIEFEVTNAMTEDLAISSIELISTNHNLSGGFTTSLAGLTETGASYSNYPAVTAASGAKKNAAVSFGTSGLTLGANKKLTFTIFLLPESNLNDLTFRINRKGTNEYIQTKLARSETEYLTFARCKKHFVKGLLADEGVKWMLDFAAQVVSWTEGYFEDSEIYDQNNYTFEVNGSSDWSSLLYNNTTSTLAKTLTVKSYTSPKEDDTDTKAVPFDATYSVDGGLTWSSFDAATSGSAKNGLYGLAGTSNAGSVNGQDYTLTAAARTASQPGSHEYWVGDHGDWSPEDWTDPDDIISLNQYNFITDSDVFKENTANCYIIRHAGIYCIPMVYGNGQLNGSNNKKAYWFGSQTSDALENCLNYKGDPITNPIIAEDLGIVTDYGTDGSKETLSSQVNRTLGKFSAEVLWSDVSGVIKNLGIVATPEFSWNGYYHTTHGIYFEVDPNTVCQCNAVIALKDASTGLIIWSWHIWITNNPAVGNPVYETVMDNGRIVDYFPMPAIGYKDGTVYFGKPKTLLKLRQQRSGKEIMLTINQTDVSEGSSVMYYQHGRKDPFSATATFGTMPSGDAVVNASKAPSTPFASWNDGGYSNLWSGAYSTLGSLVYVQDAMRKTIYDPSPRGFIVPVQTAFAPFTSDTRMLGGFANGYTFKLSDEDKEGAFFGAYGYKTSGSAVTGSGTKGMFWTSVPESSSNGGAFEFNSSSVSLPVDIPLSAACPVRPVTDPNFAQ